MSSSTTYLYLKSQLEILTLNSDYIECCEKYLNNKKIKNITESHHIFPISIFGKNNIVIHVPIKEHFNLHVLLAETIKDAFDLEKRKMSNAVHIMTKGRGKIFTAEEYEIARLAVVRAKQGTCTVFDITTNSYKKGVVDNIRFFTCNQVITPEGYKTWMSDKDPEFKNCKKAESIQLYYDEKTNKNVKISTSVAKLDPQRYKHVLSGTTFSVPANKSMNHYYDHINDKIIRMDKDTAIKNGFSGCSNYKNIITGEVKMMPPVLAKNTQKFIFI